jgi:membrane protease YdiL (CAAX protease family)
VRKRGHALIAWVVIIALVSLTAFLQAMSNARRQQTANQTSAPEGVAPSTANQRGDPVAQALGTAQARYLIGAHSFLGQGGEQFLDQLHQLPIGSEDDRFRIAIFAGELGGPKEALKDLDAIRKEKQNSLTPDQAQLLDILRRLYADYAALRLTAPSVTKAERDLLPEKLGWAGELALVPAGVTAPPDAEAVAGAAMSIALTDGKSPDPEDRDRVLEPARRTFITMIAGVCGFLGVALLGLIGLGVMGLLAFNRHVRGRLWLERGNGGIYAETFAVWMLLFLGLGFLPRLFLPSDLPAIVSLAVGAAAFFLSLLALLWPVLRGIPWSVVRREIGWTGGNRPLTEVLWGIAWYAMSLPILLIGLLVTLLFLFIKGALERGGGSAAGREAAHPVIGEIVHADPWTLVMILLLASVAAPIIEETFFRGVLHRHLREATGRWGTFLSVVFSGGLVSFIFAVIHPQGYLAVPVLMSLAFGFTLAREHRGTLLPSMVAHGINNGLVLMLSVLMLTG